MAANRILITGCAGFIGSAIFKYLSDEQYKVYGVDDHSFCDGRRLNGYSYVTGRFQDLDVSYFDTLIHTATSNIIYQIKYPVDTFRNNALDTIRLFKRFNGRIIYLSTASVYGNVDGTITEGCPEDVSNAYDQSKLIAEYYLRLRGNFVTFRLSNVYGQGQYPDGPYSGVIGKVIGKALKNEQIDIVSPGTQTRDFTHISDVVDAVEAVINEPVNHETYNISSGIDTAILDIAETVKDMTGSKSEINFIPDRGIDKIMKRRLSYDKAANDFGYAPRTNLINGIEKTIQWIKSL